MTIYLYTEGPLGRHRTEEPVKPSDRPYCIGMIKPRGIGSVYSQHVTVIDKDNLLLTFKHDGKESSTRRVLTREEINANNVHVQNGPLEGVRRGRQGFLWRE